MVTEAEARTNVPRFYHFLGGICVFGQLSPRFADVFRGRQLHRDVTNYLPVHGLRYFRRAVRWQQGIGTFVGDFPFQ